MDPCLLFIFQFYLCCAVLSVPSSIVMTYWERADLLALLFVVFSCVFVNFPYGVPGQIHVKYLVVYIPDLCRLLYSYTSQARCPLYNPQYIPIFIRCLSERQVG